MNNLRYFSERCRSLPPIYRSCLRREVTAYLIDDSVVSVIFPGISHILYLVEGINNWVIEIKARFTSSFGKSKR